MHPKWLARFLPSTSGQILTTSAEVTLNGGLVMESPLNPLNSGLGIILICPDLSLDHSWNLSILVVTRTGGARLIALTTHRLIILGQSRHGAVT